MADEYNPITLNEFPTTGKILSSDQFIAFEEIGEDLSPNLYQIIDLSAIAILSGDIESIQNKANAVENMIKNAMVYLQKTYITKTEASTIYATKDELTTAMNKLKTLSAFQSDLKNKATKEYLDSLYNNLLAKCKAVKTKLGTASWDDQGHGYKLVAAAKAAKKE